MARKSVKKGQAKTGKGKRPGIGAGNEATVEQRLGNFAEVFENSPVFMSVSDPDTYELLFINKAMSKVFGGPSVGMKCYKAFENRNSPCENCMNDVILKTRMPHTWDYFDENLKRHFLITAQIIRWHNGRDVRFETSIDITDQKKVETLLQASEEKYRSLIENSSYGYFILNSKGEVTYLNEVATKIYGRNLKSVKGRKVRLSEFFDSADLERASANLIKLAKGDGAQLPAIYTVNRPDGKTRIIEVQTFPIMRDGSIEGFHGTVIDITERAKAETELKEKSELLDAVFNNASDGIFVVNEDLVYVMINPASGRILGHNPIDWIGKKAGQFKHPEDAKTAGEAVMRIVNGEPSSRCEVRVQAADGNYHLLHIRYNPMFLGEEFHLLGMVTDITESRKAEMELKESEEKYRNLFENSPDAIMLLDSEGFIIECNKATQDIFRIDIKKIVGKGLTDICQMEKSESDYLKGVLVSVANGSRVESFDIEFSLRGGEEKCVEFFPQLMKERNEFYAIQLITRDITDRSRAEKEMKKRLMKFDIAEGRTYLATESCSTISVEAFKELLNAGYQGAMVTRAPKADYAHTIDRIYSHYTVSEQPGTDSVKPETAAIEEMAWAMPRHSALLMNCLEYLVSRLGEMKVIHMIQNIRDIAAMRKLVVILSLDSSTVSVNIMKMISKETSDIVPTSSLLKISMKLLEIIEYIEAQSKKGNNPTFSEIGAVLGLSKPTLRSRVKQLEALGIIIIKPHGRTKTLQLTDRSKYYLRT